MTAYDGTTALPIDVTPTGGALGAEVYGVDLRNALAPGTVDLLHTAILEHLVLVIRDQDITEEDQVRFTSHFGTPVEHVRKQADRPVREVFVISNVSKDDAPIGALGNHELAFHSDLSYMPKPGTYSLLYATEVPEHGGDTSWCNCYRAYETLDPATKQRIAELRATHRHPIPSQNPPQPASHPVVRTHPLTGGKALYVSPHLTTGIQGLPDAESRALLERLFAHMTRSGHVWTHRWRVGDLVIWDNRATMHRREPFPPEERRIMKRTQIFGDEVPV